MMQNGPKYRASDIVNFGQKRLIQLALASCTVLIVSPTATQAKNSTDQTQCSGNCTAQRKANNDAPLAMTDRVKLRNTSAALNALANDVDANGDQLILLKAAAKFGAVAYTSGGLLAYTQNPGELRADKITYTITDGRGGFSDGIVEIDIP